MDTRTVSPRRPYTDLSESVVAMALALVRNGRLFYFMPHNCPSSVLKFTLLITIIELLWLTSPWYYQNKSCKNIILLLCHYRQSIYHYFYESIVLSFNKVEMKFRLINKHVLPCNTHCRKQYTCISCLLNTRVL